MASITDNQSVSNKWVQIIYSPDKCQCRVWNNGWGTQCTCRPVDGTNRCKRHTNKDPGLGLITESRPPKPTDPKGRVLKWADQRNSKKPIKSVKNAMVVPKIQPDSISAETVTRTIDIEDTK